MTETESMMFEVLKRIQSDLADVKEGQGAIATDMRSIKQHMAGFMTAEFNQDAELASLRLRLERIERRLDLVD